MSLVTRGFGRSSSTSTVSVLPPKIVSDEVGELFLHNDEIEPDVVNDTYIDPPAINVKVGKKFVPEFG